MIEKNSGSPGLASSHQQNIEPETRRLRVATWNMDNWKRDIQQRQDAWSHLCKGELADVVLLQETVPPLGLAKTQHAYREIGGHRNWGTAVASFNNEIEVDEIGTVRSKYSSSRFSMLGTVPGSILVSRVSLPDVGPITFVSVYGLINVYSQTTMLRIVADLIPLFDSPDGQRVILGGDFNVTTASRPNEEVYPRYEAVLKAVESLGLENVAKTAAQRPETIEGCLCGKKNCLHLQTYGDSPGTQLDWLYASPELAGRCQTVSVKRGDPFSEWSDHYPIVAEFDVPVGIPDRIWEPESIIKEIGIRHGETQQRVMAELINWAYIKHGKLSRSYNSASFNRLPTSVGDDPVIWLQLDLKRPERIQYSFSINARGDVVVQFQYMIAPFDTEEAREELYSRINALPGVNIEKKLNGRPTFPMASLSDAGLLEQFTAIFDEFVDRTIEHHVKHVKED